jgi:hypothetical protein
VRPWGNEAHKIHHLSGAIVAPEQAAHKGKEVNSMSKEDMDIGKRIAEVGKLLSPEKMEYFVGYADGVVAMADSLNQKAKANEPKAE